MIPATIKFSIRALGAIVALLGLSGLFFTFVLFLPKSITSGSGFGIGFALISLVLDSYFVYIGYLVWFRWSPLAVRHVVGTLAFMLFAAIPSHPDYFRDITARELSPLIVFAGLLVLLGVYHWSVSYCCSRLFPTSPPVSTPPAWKFVFAFLVFGAVLGLIVYSWSYQLTHRITP